MIPNIIPYEEDEVFYSWIMRIIMHNYADESYPKAFKEWVNPQKYNDLRHIARVNYDFKENLYYWIQNAGWSQEDAIYYFMNTSLYPIISPFMTQYQRNLYILLAFGKLTLPQIKTLNNILPNITTKLKLCPDCAKEEIQNKGFFWYHRAHQIPGVAACYKHNLKLLDCTRRKFHELDIDEIEITDIGKATEAEQQYALFTYQYLKDPKACSFDHMHTFVIKQIQEKFPKDGGILFEKYTKERGYYSLFDIKPSYFFYRKQENGTFFDPHNDLVALFTLYQDYQHFKEQTEKINIQESYNIHIHNLIKYVDIYVEKNEKINESNVSRHKPRNKELFEEEIKCITGDEYQLIGDYEKSSKKVTLLHRGCNRKFEIKPISFLSGKRCKYCTQFTHTDNFCIYVENATNKRYTVLGLATNNLYIIHDRETLLDFILDKAKVLQEINRKDGSLYFENINVNVDNLVASSNRIYHDICRTTADNNPIFMEDIINLDRSRPDYMVKGSFRKLKDDGLIIKCYPGVYRFPKDEFTDMELLEARYIRRGNNIIGTYYGNSLASLFLGLKAIDDETRYILTNKEAGTHGRNRTIFGIKVRLKGCKCEITEENYIVLQTLDFLLNYWKYTDANREEVISHVTQYWVKNEIPVSLIIKYKGIYEWKQNSICECAIEVLKCVYQKKENDDKNED